MRGAIFVAVVGVDGVDSGLQMVLLDVAGGDNLAIVKAEKGFGVCRAHHAPADDADGDALVYGDTARAREGRSGEGSGGCGGLDELATGDGHLGSGEMASMMSGRMITRQFELSHVPKSGHGAPGK